LSDIKSAVILVLYLSGYRYLGDGRRTPIGVKVCMISSGHKVSVLVAMSLGVTKCETKQVYRRKPQNAVGKQKMQPRTTFNMAAVRHLEF